MKRILSLVLCALMVVTIIPMTVAAEAEWTNIYTVESKTVSTSAKTETIDISNAQEKIEITLDWTFGDNRGGTAMAINGKSLMAVSNGSKNTRITVNGGGSQLNTLNNVPLTFNITIYLEETVVGEKTYKAGDVYTVVTNTQTGATSKGTITVLPEGATELGDTLTLQFGALTKNTATLKNLNVYTYVEQAGGATLPTPEEVAAAIKVDGYQKSAVENGVYNVRFAVVINGFFAGQDFVGVDITTTAGGGKSWDDLRTDTVYRSIKANYGVDSVTAAERGGQYITTADIEGVPTSEGAITFVITPYVIIGEDKVYGEAKTVTVDPAAE